LSKPPRTLKASWRVESFFKDGKPSERIAKSKLPASEAKKMPKATRAQPVTYALAL